MFVRKFIMLNKQDTSDLKGHAKLEVRNNKTRISLNLESAETSRNILYKLFIVSDESKGLNEVELATVDISPSARGKLDLSFNSSQVGVSKLEIKDFNILILKKYDKNKNTQTIALAGYIHRDDSSLSKIKNKTIEQLDKIEKIKDEPKIQIESKVEEEIISDRQEFTSQSLQSHEEMGAKHYSNQIASYTLDILKVFKQVNPFKIEFENYKWWQIDHGEMDSHRGFLPYYSYILNSNYQNRQSKYATCQGQIEKYSHYLFGMVEEDGEITHYLYAIPGNYEKSEHPYGGKTGFVTWLEDKGNSGYWLSYIDANTGNVVKPRKTRG